MPTNTKEARAEIEMPGLDEIEAAALACTPLNLDSIADGKSDGGWVECPACNGEGSVELEADYCNFDGLALGVQFYGIGHAHGAAERFVRAANPQSVLALIRLARAALGAGGSDKVDAERYRAVREFGSQLKLYVYDDENDLASGDWLYKPSPEKVDEFADEWVAKRSPTATAPTGKDGEA